MTPVIPPKRPFIKTVALHGVALIRHPILHAVARGVAYDGTMRGLNRQMEAKYKLGLITYNVFDWHLRTMNGV